MIESALTSGICSMGADVVLLGPLPTPGVAFITKEPESRCRRYDLSLA